MRVINASIDSAQLG